MNHNLKYYAIVFVLGCVSALSMAPASWWFVLLATLPALLYCLDTVPQRKRHALALGYLFAFGYFLCSLSWIGSALLVEGNGYRWAYPLAIMGVPLFLSLYWGLAGLVYYKVRRKSPLLNTALFAITFGSAELIRGYAFTGFPWNLMGYSWYPITEIAQSAALFTIYGLTYMTLFWAASLRALVSKAFLPLIVAIASFAALYLHGYNNLINAPAKKDPVNVNIVDAGIPQSEKWKNDKLYANFQAYLNMSRYHGQYDNEKHTLIVWPETAIADIFYKDKGLNGMIQEMLQTYPYGATLITGALRQESEGIYNSLVVIDAQGEVTATYDKSHLVPFGEYIPFQDYIPLAPVNNFSGFIAGSGPTVINIGDKIKIAPSICYELIFPHSLIPDNATLDYIVNVTNDSWYEKSAGPQQHFVQSYFRSIEYKTPIIRAASGGVSAKIP